MKRQITNPMLRETVYFVQTAAETNGAVSQLEITLLPGGGNPLHYHTSYTERFTALKGDLYLELMHQRTVRLKPGESYLVQRKEVHRFFNPGHEEIRFRNEVQPGHEGFENTLRILSGLAADGLYNKKGMPKHFSHLAICGVMSDMRLPGWLAFTTPLLQFVTRRARRKGIEQQLLDKYCR